MAAIITKVCHWWGDDTRRRGAKPRSGCRDMRLHGASGCIVFKPEGEYDPGGAKVPSASDPFTNESRQLKEHDIKIETKATWIESPSKYKALNLPLDGRVFP